MDSFEGNDWKISYSTRKDTPNNSPDPEALKSTMAQYRSDMLKAVERAVEEGAMSILVIRNPRA